MGCRTAYGELFSVLYAGAVVPWRYPPRLVSSRLEWSDGHGLFVFLVSEPSCLVLSAWTVYVEFFLCDIEDPGVGLVVCHRYPTTISVPSLSPFHLHPQSVVPPTNGSPRSTTVDTHSTLKHSINNPQTTPPLRSGPRLFPLLVPW